MIVQIFGHHVENVVEAFITHGQHFIIETSPDDPQLVACDLLIAFPPCKFLCSSGLHWNTRRPGRALQTLNALALVQKLMDAPAERICIENPVGCISSQIRKPNQIIHPYQFGHDASKRTCLWLKNLPELQPTRQIAPRLVGVDIGSPGKERWVQRWANQFDSGQNNLINATDRALLRAERYRGIADAMAQQWGIL